MKSNILWDASGSIWRKCVDHLAVWNVSAVAGRHCFRQYPLKPLQVGDFQPHGIEMLQSHLTELGAGTRGLIKLVADAATDCLLGAHVLAPEGSDSIQTAVLAIKHGITVQDLGATIFLYLTTKELKLAAQAFERNLTMLSCCAG